MRFNWSNYFSLAEALNRQKGQLANSDACQRSAISRAYYAVFHIAWDYALELNDFPQVNTENIHEQVRKYYQTSPDARRQIIGILLDRLRQNRNKADYTDEIKGLDQLTASALISAKQCIDGVFALK